MSQRELSCCLATIGIAAFSLAASTSPRVTGVEATGAFKQNIVIFLGGGFSFFKVVEILPL